MLIMIWTQVHGKQASTRSMRMMAREEDSQDRVCRSSALA